MCYISLKKELFIQLEIVISVTNLPSPVFTGNVSVEQAIENRRSVRQFSNDSITLDNLSQILWSAQGITDSEKV